MFKLIEINTDFIDNFVMLKGTLFFRSGRQETIELPSSMDETGELLVPATVTLDNKFFYLTNRFGNSYEYNEISEYPPKDPLNELH